MKTDYIPGDRVRVISNSAAGRVGTVTENRPANAGVIVLLDGETDDGTGGGFGYSEVETLNG